MAKTEVHPSIETQPVAEAGPGVKRSASQWYALYTYARHEKYVAKQLEERCIDYFLPLYRTWHRWKDRRKQVELALFPSYVFVHICMAARLRVLSIAGVVHLVAFNGQPAALPERE